MTFAQDEAGSQSNRPLEIYDITHGTTTFRIASGNRDVVYGANSDGFPGYVYTAIASARSEIAIVDARANSPHELELSLPIDHPLVTRYLLNGVPPSVVSVVVRRIQQVSGESQLIWAGNITSLATEGVVAKFLIPSRAGQLMRRRLPTIAVDTVCANVLYDRRCRITQGSFTVFTTVISLDGNIVRVDMTPGHTGTWSQFGILTHAASGEPMTILSQDDVEPTGPSSVADLTMQYPIAGLKIGDAVLVSAGCDHLVTTCNGKFSNQVNFVGLPQRPTANIFIPGGFGIMEGT